MREALSCVFSIAEESCLFFVDLERLKFGWFESSPGNIKRNLRMANFSSRISKSLYVP